MSEPTFSRVITYAAGVLAALLLGYGAAWSVSSQRFTDARNPLEVCAASKGALCDASSQESTPQTPQIATLRHRRQYRL